MARYEDLRVWQAAKDFCHEISRVVQACNDNGDFPLGKQLNAAALSTMANIAEGFLRRRDKEFAYFLRVAVGSNGEARSLLYVAAARKYVGGPKAAQLVSTTNQIGGMLRRFEQTLR